MRRLFRLLKQGDRITKISEDPGERVLQVRQNRMEHDGIVIEEDLGGDLEQVYLTEEELREIAETFLSERRCGDGRSS